MSIETLEKRLTVLESQVIELRDELRRSQSQSGKDWRKTIGAFTDDEEMKEILRQAMRLREAEREKARSTRPTKRRPS